MQNLPFDKPGRFWRGNLHMHSTGSDGYFTPQQACDFYRENGYDFTCVTDHFRPEYGFPVTDTRGYRTADFTTIIGAELHPNATDCGEWWHILTVGLPLDFAPMADDEDAAAIVQRALDAGAFVAAAHPSWYALSMADVISLGDIHAVEIFNGGAVNHNDSANSWPILDALINRGHRYFGIAVDDAHARPQDCDLMQGWVHVKAEDLSPDSLLTALKEGHFYASTGPQIHDIQIAPGKTITVRCSPVDSIFVTGRTWLSRRAHDRGITEATFDLSTFDSPFCRVTVRDQYGNRAWSNPIWFE